MLSTDEQISSTVEQILFTDKRICSTADNICPAVEQVLSTCEQILLTAHKSCSTPEMVLSTAEQLYFVQLANGTAGAFTVAVTGHFPTRSATTMEFRFAPFVDPNNKELKLETHSLTLTVDGPFASGTRAWRQAFGSLFTAKVTFNIRGDIVQSGPRRHDEQQPGDIEFRIWPVALFASNYTATNCSLSVL